MRDLLLAGDVPRPPADGPEQGRLLRVLGLARVGVAGLDEQLAPLLLPADVAAARTVEDLAAAGLDRSLDLLDDLERLHDDLTARAAPLRAGSTAAELLRRAPALPVLSAASVAVRLRRSRQAATTAVRQLSADAVLVPLSLQRWGRTYAVAGLAEVVEPYTVT